jgi:hypothetical protein
VPHNPLSEVIDVPLAVTDETMRALAALRSADKFLELPGEDTTAERLRLTSIFDAALDRLILGLRSNPNKLWFMTQIQPALSEVSGEDTEARECFGKHVEAIMDIVGIQSSDGVLSFYLGGISAELFAAMQRDDA